MKSPEILQNKRFLTFAKKFNPLMCLFYPKSGVRQCSSLLCCTRTPNQYLFFQVLKCSQPVTLQYYLIINISWKNYYASYRLFTWRKPWWNLGCETICLVGCGFFLRKLSIDILHFFALNKSSREVSICDCLFWFDVPS